MKVLQLLKAQAKAKEITEYNSDSVPSRITRTGKSNISLTEWTMYCFEFCLGNAKHSDTGEKNRQWIKLSIFELWPHVYLVYFNYFFKMCLNLYTFMNSAKIFLLRLFAYTVSHLFGQIQYTLLIKNHSQTFFCSFYTNADVYPTFTRQFKSQNTLKSMYMNLTTQYSFNLTAF